jgi:hypothetical protein
MWPAPGAYREKSGRFEETVFSARQELPEADLRKNFLPTAGPVRSEE